MVCRNIGGRLLKVESKDIELFGAAVNGTMSILRSVASRGQVLFLHISIGCHVLTGIHPAMMYKEWL